MRCMDRVLVIGATGNIVREVVSPLASRGIQLRAMTRKPDAAVLPPQVEVMRGALTAWNETTWVAAVILGLSAEVLVALGMLALGLFWLVQPSGPDARVVGGGGPPSAPSNLRASG